MSSEVVLFKLNTGEEMIGRCESQDDEYYTVKHASVAVAGQDQNIALAPFFFLANQSSVKLKKSCVIATATVPLALEKKFMEDTSGIVLPS